MYSQGRKIALQALEEMDSLFVDTSFFGNTGNGLAQEIYTAESAADLENLCGLIEREHLCRMWQNNHILSHEKVRTVEGIIAEEKDFFQHLQGVYTYCQRREKDTLLKKKRTTGKFQRQKVGLRRDYFRKLIPHWKEAQYNPLGEKRGLQYLNSLLLDVETTIASLKKYSDYRLYLKYLVTHASTEDYELAESALGYAMKEKGKKVGILTGDGHFYKILSKAIFKDLYHYKMI